MEVLSKSRQARYGPGCTLRPGAIWQAWLAAAPPATVRQAWRGPSYWDWVARQAAHDSASQDKAGNAWHGVAIRRKAGMSALGGDRSPMARQAWNSTAAPVIAGYAAHRWASCGSAGLAWLPMLRTGRQCEESRCMYRHGRHGTHVKVGTAHHGRQGVVRRSRSGLASQVKAGMALLVQARLARSRWPCKGSKSRQARCSVDRLLDPWQAQLATAVWKRHNGALRGPFHPRENQWPISHSGMTRSALS